MEEIEINDFKYELSSNNVGTSLGLSLKPSEIKPSRVIEKTEEFQEIDKAEGMNDEALNEFYSPQIQTRKDKIKIFIISFIVLSIIYTLFPWSRFFSPRVLESNKTVPLTLGSKHSNELNRFYKARDYSEIIKYCESEHLLNDLSKKETRAYAGFYLQALYCKGLIKKTIEFATKCVDEQESFLAGYYFKYKYLEDFSWHEGFRIEGKGKDETLKYLESIKVELKKVYKHYFTDSELNGNMRMQQNLCRLYAHVLVQYWCVDGESYSKVKIDNLRDPAVKIYMSGYLKNDKISIIAFLKLLNIIDKGNYYDSDDFYLGTEDQPEIVEEKIKELETRLKEM